MTRRRTAPPGAPCWADLWTSDVEGSRRFYAGLFGWEPQDPDPSYGGYFLFEREGEPVAGAMGPMDGHADDRWKPYLCTPDLPGAVGRVAEAGGEVAVPAMAVGHLGTQSVVVDPGGAPIGLWEPKEFEGFCVLGETSAPSWFELHCAEPGQAISFYEDVAGLDFVLVSDTDAFRYFTFRSPGTGTDLGGVMEARAPSSAAAWSIYWEVAEVDAALAQVLRLGGRVVVDPEDTPWGRLAEAADPAGATFKLRTSPST